MTGVNHYCSHTFNGDKLTWEYFKYSVFSSFLFSYYRRKTFVRLIYPSEFHCPSKMSNFFADVFELAYEFDFFNIDDVQYKSHKLAYLDKASKSKEPLLMISDDIAPTAIFMFDADDKIRFMCESAKESKYAKVYEHIGVYDKVYDDRVMYVPKNICERVLKDIDRIQKDFGFNDKFLDGIAQFVIQTHALIGGVEIETIGKEYFTPITDSRAMFLSNCSSNVLGEDQ